MGAFFAQKRSRACICQKKVVNLRPFLKTKNKTT